MKREFKPFQIRWAEPMGRAECPYAHRWCLITPLFSMRLHHWRFGDDSRYFHDHPFWFVVFILRGMYWDVTPMNQNLAPTMKEQTMVAEPMTAGSIRFRRAEHKHFVLVPRGKECWSLLLTGRSHRNWGFYVDTKFKRPLKYFHKYGHPPCEA